MIMGSITGLPGIAPTAPGDLTIGTGSTIGAGTGPIAVTASGTGGSTSATSWEGHIAGVGTQACIDFAIEAHHEIDWSDWSVDPTDPVIATLSDLVIVFDSIGCPAAPTAVCMMIVEDYIILLTSYTWAVGLADAHGTFVNQPCQTIGSYTIAEGTNCYSSGLAALLTSAVDGGGPPGSGEASFDITFATSLDLT